MCVRACVRTLDSLKGKNRVANRGSESGSPHLRVCGRAWAYVCACAGGVQRGYKGRLDKFERMCRKIFLTGVLDKMLFCVFA